MEIGNTEIIKKFVTTGLCLSVLPEFDIQNEVWEGKISKVPIKEFSFKMYSPMFYHKDKYLIASMRYFLELMEAR